MYDSMLGEKHKSDSHSKQKTFFMFTMFREKIFSHFFLIVNYFSSSLAFNNNFYLAQFEILKLPISVWINQEKSLALILDEQMSDSQFTSVVTIVSSSCERFLEVNLREPSAASAASADIYVWFNLKTFTEFAEKNPVKKQHFIHLNNSTKEDEEMEKRLSKVNLKVNSEVFLINPSGQMEEAFKYTIKENGKIK